MNRVVATNAPAIAFVETLFVDRYRAVGTATLIGPRLLLTAGHVVFDHYRVRNGQAYLTPKGDPASIKVTLGGKSSPRFTMQASSWRADPTWINSHSKAAVGVRIRSSFDVGAIVLPEAVDDRVGGMFVPQTTDDSVLLGLRMDVAGFSSKEFFQPPQVPPDMMWASATLNHRLLPQFNDRLAYSVQTVTGMSGGPVWSFDPATGRTIRAVHTSFINGTGGSALRITEHVKTLINQWQSSANNP